MRDIVVFAIVFGALPFAFFRPFYGLLLFTWLAYLRAPDLCWGPAKSFRFSAIVGLIMFVGWFLFDHRAFFRKDRRNLYVVLLALMVTISYAFAPVHNDGTTTKYVEFAKVIIVAIFTTGQLDSKVRIRAMILVIALSFGFYGVKGGLWGMVTHDARILRGPGGMLEDNNDFALAMVMNLPLLYYLSFAEENKRFRRFLKAAVLLTTITIVLTGSRGGFLSMSVVYFAIVMKSRYKQYAIPVAFAGGVLFLIFLPDRFKERLASIKTASKEDASAIGRLKAWGVALEMIKAHPVLGVGFRNFTYQYRKYDPESDKSIVRVAHNSYLQIWAETGSFAFLFFLSAVVSTILLMRRLQRMNRTRDGPAWVRHYAMMIEVSLYGYLMGAMFLNRGHFDMMYSLIGIAVALYPVAVRAMARSATVANRGPARLVVRASDPFLAGGSR